MSTQAATLSNPTVELPHRDSVAEVMAASMIGTAIEFYDNYCYSIAAASYFGYVFFTNVAKQNPFLATLLAFVTFAVSFLARPFGSLLFGHFGDKLGRKKTLVAALLMMGISTFVVGVLPGYSVLGPMAVVLLCVCRACQGLGLAGEWSGAALVATENAPANKRALWGSFPNLGPRWDSSSHMASTCCWRGAFLPRPWSPGAGACRSCFLPCSWRLACSFVSA